MRPLVRENYVNNAIKVRVTPLEASYFLFPRLLEAHGRRPVAEKGRKRESGAERTGYSKIAVTTLRERQILLPHSLKRFRVAPRLQLRRMHLNPIHLCARCARRRRCAFEDGVHRGYSTPWPLSRFFTRGFCSSARLWKPARDDLLFRHRERFPRIRSRKSFIALVLSFFSFSSIFYLFVICRRKGTSLLSRVTYLFPLQDFRNV